MERLQKLFVVCLITGLVAILPIGGTILFVVFAERSLSPLVPSRFYFPGEGLLLVIASLQRPWLDVGSGTQSTLA
jgi:hypothetical protein